MMPKSSSPRVFGVDYRFLSAGSVFTDGLVHAADSLGLVYAHADWADPRLPALVKAFEPDLLFVVHGRRFVQRWRTQFALYRSAVWLLDEPYEVDDTSKWSSQFGHVFASDPSTIGRHAHASYLPVCYDPQTHFESSGDAPIYRVGFIGGGNGTREHYLSMLAKDGQIDYLVGGPWNSPVLRRLCRALTIPPRETAALYRATRIVLNVFRERHHYNAQKLPATSMNPRIYEATACGALVLSEWRPEIEARVPQLPTFKSAEECVSLVTKFLENYDELTHAWIGCKVALESGTYEARLRTVLQTVGLLAEVAA